MASLTIAAPSSRTAPTRRSTTQRPPRPPARGARQLNARPVAELSTSPSTGNRPETAAATAPAAAARRSNTRQPVRLTHRGRRLVRTAVVVLALMVTLVVLSVSLGAVSSASEGSDGPTTRSVVVQPGQTLWSLASAALPGMDPREAVSRVADLNGLGPSSQIVPGQPLLLPLGG